MNFCVFHILKTQKLQFAKVQQKSKKVLLLCFVTFVTFVFYAHPGILVFRSDEAILGGYKPKLIWWISMACAEFRIICQSIITNCATDSHAKERKNLGV